MTALRQDGRHWRRLATAGTIALVAAGSAWSCGLEDPNSASVQRGAMNLAFPQSAWVRTAIWQAQMAGELPRDEPAGGNESTAARGTLQLMRAGWLLKALAARTGSARDGADAPAVALVLMGPMLWSRIAHGPEGSLAQVHVDGPVAGDVVMVTDLPVLAAIVEGGMRFERALELGLVRLYGAPARVAAAQAWFAST